MLPLVIATDVLILQPSSGFAREVAFARKVKILHEKYKGEGRSPSPSILHPFCISGAPTVSGTEIIAAYPPGGALSSYDIVVTIQLLIGRRSRRERHSRQNDDERGQGYEFACESFQHDFLLCCE